MSWVASLLSRTASDDPSAMMAIGLGIIFETHLARLLDVEVALGLAAVGPDLDEIPDQRLQRRQIGAHLGGLRLLVGVEGRENIGGDIAARIRDHRIRRHLGRPRRHRGLVLRAQSARRRRAPWARALEPERFARTRVSQRRRRMSRSAAPVRNGSRDGWMVVSFDISDLYSTRHDLTSLATSLDLTIWSSQSCRFGSFYRAFDQRRYRFSVKIVTPDLV